MKNFLKKLYRRRVSSKEALRIVRECSLSPLDCFRVYDSPQPGWILYNSWGDEPCWYVTAPGDIVALQSTKVVVVSRKSGKVLAVTSANDEG